MASLSISEAWNETASFIRRESQLVFPIGFLLISLPSALSRMAIPEFIPGELPAPGIWLALLPLSFLLSLVGYVAISTLALRPGTSVGESLQHGARRLVPVFAAALLMGVAGILAGIPLILLAGGLGMVVGNPMAAGLLFLLFALPVVLFVWARMLLMTPAAAAEEIGPVAIIRRSWDLTRAHVWNLVGFLLLVGVVVLVILMAVGAVGGVLVIAIAGPAVPGSLSAWLMLIISALVGAAISTVFAVMVARIYAQLAGRDPAALFT